MGSYRVNDNLEMIGGFWVYNKPQDIFGGTLSVKGGKADLFSGPIYEERVDPNEGFRKLADDLNNRAPVPEIPSICGFVDDGDCTLLDCLDMGKRGGRNEISSGRSVSSRHFRPDMVVMGMHLESRKSHSISSAAFYYTNTNEYLAPAWRVNMEAEEMIYSAPRRARELFRFDSAALDAEVICQTFASGGMRGRSRANIRSVPRIKITPASPQSVNWFRELAFRIENFFALFMGSSIALKRFQLFNGDKTGLVLHRYRGKSEKPKLPAWVRCTEDMVSGALEKWLAVPAKDRPVELMVLGMLRNSSLYVETEFLSLVQALEGFSRIRSGPKRKSLAEMAGETYDMLSRDFAIKVAGDRSDFTHRVVATRNFFTHLGLPEKPTVVRDAGRLFVLNQRIHALLRCAMLMQLGIPEQVLVQPILYQANRWS